MSFDSCFDIIGPIMVGPSSSHTAGAVSIGRFIYEWLGDVPEWAEITLYGSFADTFQGHGTDKAIVGGLLGMDARSHGIRESQEEAKKKKMNTMLNPMTDVGWRGHPNTAVIKAHLSGQTVIVVEGASIGGGLAEIRSLNNEPVRIAIAADAEIKQIAAGSKNREGRYS
ncbi:L-serine dehydratase [Sinobaca qinghaiensis]|uniref:L-serine ammonia-lyase n=1 Tax=Sinobaca qinghaiensis TaxID=342944 RepID=A0A419UWK3_9BACL|nr:serine dehydratase beta chain [Sinobaca qinghaiensis]RKD69510.1 L-serine dehydratase [Sinobaca qinghaiensis]